jgi:hypothetical protein
MVNPIVLDACKFLSEKGLKEEGVSCNLLFYFNIYLYYNFGF